MAGNPFRGYLIKAVTRQSTAPPYEDAVFPLNYILWDSYKSTPNQREEIKAYRDENTRNLTRVTASGKKSVIEFKLRQLHLADKMFIQGWLHNAEENTQEAHEQRKIQLEFWDDEENTYKTGYFYRPNTEFEILRLMDDDIVYKELTLKFVEY